MLDALGWPSGTDRLAAARARFQDLLRLPAVRVGVSTFSLEDDSIVAPSAFADEVGETGFVVQQETPRADVHLFDYEALSIEPVDAARASGDAASWLAFRQQLAPADSPQFHGQAGPRAPGVYAVSRVERYLECPFKYFAAHVLRLDEERAEESGLTPQERGMFLHTVFEKFFAAWHASGRAAITADTLEEALAAFETVAEAHLATLRESDRALERTHLLGSAVAPGLAERAFAFEIEHGVGVVERLLEHELEGTFVFRGADGPREINLRAKADRIDLLDDGTARIVDYKIGRAPKMSRSLQLPVYSVCASQQLAGRHGREWSVSRAGYVAFREKNAFVSLGSNLEKALAEGEQRLVSAVTSIEEGTFPPRPEDPWLCSRCGFAMVCRKDYVGDDSSHPQLSLFGEAGSPSGDPKTPDREVAEPTPDEAARAFAVDPRNNVVLEASAGTGKTSVLVARYVNLIKAGVDPGNILAITFTRKAAAEMRERIVSQLREAAERSEIEKSRWNDLRARLADVAISTIDAFCLSLLKEFPLEADLDPGFEMADETEVPRIVEEALDRSLRILVSLAKDDPDIALVLAQLGIARTREGLGSLLDRRLVAWSALDRFLARGPADLTPRIVCRRAAEALQQALRAVPGGLPPVSGRRPGRARSISIVPPRGRPPERDRRIDGCRGARAPRTHRVALPDQRRRGAAERAYLPLRRRRLRLEGC